MAASQIPLDFDEDGSSFEGLAKENGTRTWSARDLMRILGYQKWPIFKKVVEKAISASALLGVPIFEHFKPATSGPKGHEDFRLSRFGCCMTVLNADSSNRNVAAAQVYFVSLAEIFSGGRIEHAQSMDRIAIREEITEREVSLSETAAAAGVESYSALSVAGYVGMYEMDYQALRRLRGVSDLPKRSVLDFMGKDELAGNLFRLAMTEGRIKKDRVRGQKRLEQVSKEVAKRTRNAMFEETGLYPEQLPTAQDIREVKKGLKTAGKDFTPLDDLETQRIAEASAVAHLMPSPNEDGVPGCPECAGGNPASHYGSQSCRSGSLASGGQVAHCVCEFCY